jgi:prepilin-type N-terminal cleavage/methylation domain-containing protein
MQNICPKNSQKGFTIIELIIVVLVVGLLSGVLVTVIDIGGQRDHARDGVLRQNLNDTVQVIETYRVTEGSYPDGGASQNPMTGSDSTLLSSYLDTWPTGLVYNEDGSDFSIHVEKATTSGEYFKYSSDWQEMRECGADGINTVDACEAL